MTLNQTTGSNLREQLIVSAHRWLSTMNDFTPDAMVSHRTEECVTRPAPPLAWLRTAKQRAAARLLQDTHGADEEFQPCPHARRRAHRG